VLQLEAENKKMREKLDHVKPLVIENINYKIQELNVEELKGTLNIGLTGETDAEEFARMMGDSLENDEGEEG
jgi:hypothetical protein